MFETIESVFPLKGTGPWHIQWHFINRAATVEFSTLRAKAWNRIENNFLSAHSRRLGPSFLEKIACSLCR